MEDPSHVAAAAADEQSSLREDDEQSAIQDDDDPLIVAARAAAAAAPPQWDRIDGTELWLVLIRAVATILMALLILLAGGLFVLLFLYTMHNYGNWTRDGTAIHPTPYN